MKRSEHERLQVALDAAGMGTFVWYVQRDYAASDARMLELFALPADGVLSLAAALASMIHPADRQRYGDAVAAALDADGGHELSQEIRVDRGDGSYRWVLVTARAFFDTGQDRADRLVGVAFDVTRRRAIGEELRAAEERRAFLLDLTDRLRLLTDPVEVQSVAVRALGARLSVSRALYFEVTPDSAGDYYTIEQDYHAPGTASVVGRYRADDFGATLFDELRAGRRLTVADVRTDPRLIAAERASYATVGIGAFTAVPLIKDGRHAAALVLQQATPRQWTEAEIALLDDVAERTWAAVERAKAEAGLRESEARFRQVVEIAPQLIWVARADGTLELLNHSWSAVTAAPMTADDRTLLAEVVHPGDRDDFLRVWDASRAAGDGFEQEARLRHVDGGHRWYLLRVVGSKDGPGTVLKWFGVATDIDERRRAAELALAEQARAREQEHRVALTLQRALLPAATVARPEVPLAARYEAGSATLEVGGDWYDTFELPGGRIALTVGDVVGHGLEAATAMGKLRVATGALAPHAREPGRLLSFLDGFAGGNDGVDFATACYAVFDPGTGELRYASAGHPPMLVVSSDGGTRWLTAGGSPPITGRPVGERPDATETLEPGALLVLYSDGLVERRREPLTVGLDRLARAAADLRHEPVPAVCDGLFAALGVADHRDDDVVVLCLRAPERTAVPFREVLVSDPRELSRLRRSLQAWRRRSQPPDRVESDLLLAVNEACANAIEHAYPDGAPGSIEITVTPAPDGSYVATVRDFGTWRPPAAASTDRGRGLNIIRDISHGFELRSTAEGTLVRFRLPTMRSAQ